MVPVARFKFVDSTFPAIESSLVPSNWASLPGISTLPVRLWRAVRVHVRGDLCAPFQVNTVVKWVRPNQLEIKPGGPAGADSATVATVELLHGGAADSADVRQGNLGDCWLVSALCVVAGCANDNYLGQVRSMLVFVWSWVTAVWLAGF